MFLPCNPLQAVSPIQILSIPHAATGAEPTLTSYLECMMKKYCESHTELHQVVKYVFPVV